MGASQAVHVTGQAVPIRPGLGFHLPPYPMATDAENTVAAMRLLPKKQPEMPSTFIYLAPFTSTDFPLQEPSMPYTTNPPPVAK